MTTVSMTQHLTEYRDRINSLHQGIIQAYLLALKDPITARGWFANLLMQVSGLEQEHNAWASTYVAEVRSAFGMNSAQEQQMAGMANGVTRMLALDAVYVQLGASTAALGFGQVNDAAQAAGDALRRCDALVPLGVDFELASQRIMTWGQMMLVAYKQACDNVGNPQAMANARQWAEQCFQEASQAGNWMLAAESKAIVASCAWVQDDRVTFSNAMGEAIQLATNSGAMIRNLASGGQYVPLASYLQSWTWEMQGGADSTGDTGYRIRQLNDSMLENLARMTAQQPR